MRYFMTMQICQNSLKKITKDLSDLSKIRYFAKFWTEIN